MIATSKYLHKKLTRNFERTVDVNVVTMPVQVLGRLFQDFTGHDQMDPQRNLKRAIYIISGFEVFYFSFITALKVFICIAV